jgi:hypothetical protein
MFFDVYRTNRDNKGRLVKVLVCSLSVADADEAANLMDNLLKEQDYYIQQRIPDANVQG